MHTMPIIGLLLLNKWQASTNENADKFSFHSIHLKHLIVGCSTILFEFGENIQNVHSNNRLTSNREKIIRIIVIKG